MAVVHPLAVVDAKANLAPDVTIGPFCCVGPNVTLGPGTVLDSNVRIDGHTTLGARVRVHAGAVLGGPPQDLSGTRSLLAPGLRALGRGDAERGGRVLVSSCRSAPVGRLDSPA